MMTDSIMPVSTQRVAMQQFEAIRNESLEPGKQLNQMFFNMMMKSMFEVSASDNKTSATTKMNQQIYIDALAQELSNNMDLGFSKLQFELDQQGVK